MHSIPRKNTRRQRKHAKKQHADPRADVAASLWQWLFKGHGKDDRGRHIELIDSRDWGHYDRQLGRPVRVTTARLNARLRGGRLYLRRLSRPRIKEHLREEAKLYYTSKRSGGYAFLRIDIDAHQGQTDDFDAAELIRATVFPGCYAEPSRRGFALYPLVRVRMRRAKFNALLRDVQAALAALLVDAGITSTVEIQGNFTALDAGQVATRGKLAALPRLHRGGDLASLRDAPVYLVSGVVAFTREMRLRAEMDRASVTWVDTRSASVPSRPRHLGPSITDNGYQSEPTGATKNADRGQKRTQSLGAHRASSAAPSAEVSGSAWDRMVRACFRFTVEYRRLPDVEELLRYYDHLHEAGPAHPERRRRAVYAIQYRSERFDYAAAPHAGYEATREQLVAAVRTHCTDRSDRFHGTLTDEDLAVGLYVITRASFGVHEDPARQWTCGHAAIMGMFDKLHQEGVTDRRCPSRHKSGAIFRLLERAGLIECQDRRYKPAGKRGISRKWTIGPAHPRYAEFVRTSDTVRVDYLDDGDACAPASGDNSDRSQRTREGKATPSAFLLTRKWCGAEVLRIPTGGSRAWMRSNESCCDARRWRHVCWKSATSSLTRPFSHRSGTCIAGGVTRTC